MSNLVIVVRDVLLVGGGVGAMFFLCVVVGHGGVENNEKNCTVQTVVLNK